MQTEILRVFLGRHETCPECGGWVVEIASCARCGATYVVGREEQIEGDTVRSSQPAFTLRQLSGTGVGQSGHPSYFLLGRDVCGEDEDEMVAVGEDLQAASNDGEAYSLCLRCGRVSPGTESPGCSCTGATVVPLYLVPLSDSQEPKRCVRCGSRGSSSVVYRFLTGQDAPVSVLATALYQKLPAAQDPIMFSQPGQGRKLLVFADSRQDAAFFAPYLERTYRQVLHRRLILQTLLRDEAGQSGRMRLQDVARNQLLQDAEAAGMFTQAQGYYERQQEAASWLMQELIALDRRLSLEGLGLLAFRLVRPTGWRPPEPLLAPPWSLQPEDAWTLIALLVDTLRMQGAVTFPQNVDVRDDVFAPRNRPIYIREEGADGKRNVLSWLPTRGINRRLDILDRLLAKKDPALPPAERQRLAVECLRGIWRHLTSPVWRQHFVSSQPQGVGVVYQVSHEFWELVPSDNGVGYRCNRCRTISAHNSFGVCSTFRCTGELEPLQTGRCRPCRQPLPRLVPWLDTVAAECRGAYCTVDN